MNKKPFSIQKTGGKWECEPEIIPAEDVAEMIEHILSDEQFFHRWWDECSPPGTFDKAQCRIAFIAGLHTIAEEDCLCIVSPWCPIHGRQEDSEA